MAWRVVSLCLSLDKDTTLIETLHPSSCLEGDTGIMKTTHDYIRRPTISRHIDVVEHGDLDEQAFVS
jgi:hypothetical protein